MFHTCNLRKYVRLVTNQILFTGIWVCFWGETRRISRYLSMASMVSIAFMASGIGGEQDVETEHPNPNHLGIWNIPEKIMEIPLLDQDRGFQQKSTV